MNKLFLACVMVISLAASPAFAVDPQKPYADLTSGNVLTAAWLMGTVNTVFTWCQNHGIATSSVHGVTGPLVGASDSQTLYQKKLVAPVLENSIASGTMTNGGTINGGTVTPATFSATSITGGNLTGNVTADSNVTVDGVDISAHAADTVAHDATGGVVGVTKAQVLTNKTLTSPVLNTPTVAGGNVSSNVSCTAGVTIDGVDIGAHDAATTSVHGAVSTNTASRIVTRDASGNFSAGVITANLTGNVTGNTSGSSGSCTGNAANVTGTVAVANGGTGGTTQAGGRSGLGLGNCSTLNVGTSAGTVAAGNDARFADSRKCDNTFDSAATSRTNLGLGTAATMTGPSGTIIGTSDAQALSNKTYTIPGNTSWVTCNTGGATNLYNLGTGQSDNYTYTFEWYSTAGTVYSGLGTQGGPQIQVYYDNATGYVKCYNAAGFTIYLRVHCWKIQ